MSHMCHTDADVFDSDVCVELSGSPLLQLPCEVTCTRMSCFSFITVHRITEPTHFLSYPSEHSDVSLSTGGMSNGQREQVNVGTHRFYKHTHPKQFDDQSHISTSLSASEGQKYSVPVCNCWELIHHGATRIWLSDSTRVTTCQLERERRPPVECQQPRLWIYCSPGRIPPEDTAAVLIGTQIGTHT